VSNEISQAKDIQKLKLSRDLYTGGFVCFAIKWWVCLFCNQTPAM